MCTIPGRRLYIRKSNRNHRPTSDPACIHDPYRYTGLQVKQNIKQNVASLVPPTVSCYAMLKCLNAACSML